MEKLGFTRAVLAREVDLQAIQDIHNQTNIELEAFVHGALCVCYSGQCYISRMMTGRSGNRGECAQICRTRFDLQDASGKTLIRNKHLLSLKDMCRADYIEAMLKAGIVSFKVEGRLKNESYVKNVTAFYRRRLDAILEGNPEYQRVGSGITRFFFTPDLHKTFNREYTQYFIDGRREQIASFDTPKAIGEPIGALIQRNGKYYVEPQYSKTSSLSSPGRGKKLGSTIVNGDGLCFINTEGELEGFLSLMKTGVQHSWRNVLIWSRHNSRRKWLKPCARPCRSWAAHRSRHATSLFQYARYFFGLGLSTS